MGVCDMVVVHSILQAVRVVRNCMLKCPIDINCQAAHLQQARQTAVCSILSTFSVHNHPVYGRGYWCIHVHMQEWRVATVRSKHHLLREHPHQRNRQDVQLCFSGCTSKIPEYHVVSYHVVC
jgi:hypothetical protein